MLERNLTIIETPTKTVWVVLNCGYEECWDDVVGSFLTIENQITFETLSGHTITLNTDHVAIMEIAENIKETANKLELTSS